MAWSAKARAASIRARRARHIRSTRNSGRMRVYGASRVGRGGKKYASVKALTASKRSLFFAGASTRSSHIRQAQTRRARRSRG
jgi:hypothetical protein